MVCPSWVGDVVMATPALRRLRRSLPGATIALLVKPGVAPILDGLDAFDELILSHPGGMMGHKHTASKLRRFAFDSALLLTNSFSSALTVRLAGIPRRLGYDRDARHLLLTHRLRAPKRADGSWAIVPAVDYYWHAAGALLDLPEPTPDLTPADELGNHRLPEAVYLELAPTERDRREADAVLGRAGVLDRAYALLNPGGNNPAKRWPTDRFARLADHLAKDFGLTVLLNGSPGEIDLLESIADQTDSKPIVLAKLGTTLGSLKPIIAGARLMVTNDTGPRHIAAAFGVPLVTLFGPTDHRWTTIPTRPEGPEIILQADPSLPPTESANDHPERCRVDRIELDRVLGAVESLLGSAEMLEPGRNS